MPTGNYAMGMRLVIGAPGPTNRVWGVTKSLLKTMVGDYSLSAFIKKLNIDKGRDCDKPQPLLNPN